MGPLLAWEGERTGRDGGYRAEKRWEAEQIRSEGLLELEGGADSAERAGVGNQSMWGSQVVGQERALEIQPSLLRGPESGWETQMLKGAVGGGGGCEVEGDWKAGFGGEA